jgi:hypothetical protein
MKNLIDRISVFLFQNANTDFKVKIYFIWVKLISRFNKDLTTPNE